MKPNDENNARRYTEKGHAYVERDNWTTHEYSRSRELGLAAFIHARSCGLQRKRHLECVVNNDRA